MADGILTPCNVARSWHWFRQVTAPCNVTRGSVMTCHWIRQVASWQHPAMWHVALESWHWIRQVAAPCNVTGGSGMTCHWIFPNIRHIGSLLLFSISAISPQSTYLSVPVLRNFIQIGPPLAEKNDVMSIFKMADLRHLGFYGSNNGFFEKPMYDFL